MRGQPGFFDVDERLKRLSDLGDHLAAFRCAVDFETFRPELAAALSYADGSEGGHPPFDLVMMFKILGKSGGEQSHLRARRVSDQRSPVVHALSWLSPSDRVPDARTIWVFRRELTKAGTINALFERFDATQQTRCRK